jgi:hypothetical protein
MIFTMQIIQSAIDVQVELDRLPSDYSLIHDLAHNMGRACVDILSFATGSYLSIYFDKFVAPDGETKNIDYKSSAVAGICTVCDANSAPELYQMLSLVISEPDLLMALNDLIEGLRPNLPAVNCGRVIDALRNIVARGEDPKKGWAKLGEMINVDAAYRKFISDLSIKPRHAERIYIDPPTTEEILKRTWTIMNRFLEFRKRGNQPLPLADFPMLLG